MGYQALLFCPDEKLARVVSQVFSELDFTVDPVNEPFAAVKKLMAQRYDAVVVDCDNEQNTALLFKSAHNSSFNQSSLAIALVEGQAGVAKAYRIGANLVLTKPINVEQTKGTLRVARGLLRKNLDGAAAATSSATPAMPPKPVPAPVQPVRSYQAPVRQVEASAPPPSLGRSPEFEASLPTMAASASTQEPVMAPAPAAQMKAPVLRTVPEAAPIVDSERTRPVVTPAEPKPAAAEPVFNTSSKSQGAAAAPAPAREVIVPAEREQKAVESAPVAQPQTAFSSAGNASDGPSFAALGDEDGSSSGGSKKILAAAAVILVVATAGYFGWTKFGGSASQSHASPTPQAAVTAPQQTATSPEVAPTPASAPAPVASSMNRSSATNSAAPAKSSASLQSAQPSLNVSPDRVAPDTTSEVKRPAPAPIQVKAAVASAKTQAQQEESAPQLPSPLAVATPTDSNLTGLMSSAASNVARPSLARLKVSQGVSQGLLIKRVQPKYPQNALAAHTQGAVQIEATVNKDGKVVNPKVLSGDPMLAAAAMDAVRQWRYKPYFLDGEPVEIQTQITINFKAN